MSTISERIKELRVKQGLTQEELAERAGYESRTSIAKIETGQRSIKEHKIAPIAKALNTTVAYLIGADKDEDAKSELLSVKMPVRAEVKAGFDAYAEEDFSEYELIPLEWLHRQNPKSFICLKIRGDSMYPDFHDGDRILVRLSPIVASGRTAVVIFDSDFGTVKKIEYTKDYMKLIPFNREYPTKVIEGADLERVHIIGEVWKTIRDNI